jgi:hypothetical protein
METENREKSHRRLIRGPAKAFCTNPICVKIHGKLRLVPKNTIECPECKSVIYWSDGSIRSYQQERNEK